MQLTFETPWFLLLLFLIPPAVYLRHFWKTRGGILSSSFSVWKEDSFVPPFSWIKLFASFFTFLFWIGLTFLLAALASPAIATKERVFLTRGIDIMLVLDESLSMAAGDFPPDNRFESAKEVMSKFINQRENDPIGLISFAKEAALRVPPTLDYQSLLSRIDNLELIQLGDGTAIGMGIALASLHLQNSSAAEKVLILLTDGDNNAGEIMPQSAADLAAQMGIRIYSIGMGTKGEVPLEYKDPDTGLIRRGIYLSGYNEGLLTEISDITGGRYFPAASPGALSTIFRTIDSMEASSKRVKVNISTNRIYREFILIGMILVLLGFFYRKLIQREVFP